MKKPNCVLLYCPIQKPSEIKTLYRYGHTRNKGGNFTIGGGKNLWNRVITLMELLSSDFDKWDYLKIGDFVKTEEGIFQITAASPTRKTATKRLAPR